MYAAQSHISHDGCEADAEAANRHAGLPDVSIVVPIKGSPKTVQELTTALLQQRYEGNVQIVYVGDFDDSAWSPTCRKCTPAAHLPAWLGTHCIAAPKT